MKKKKWVRFIGGIPSIHECCTNPKKLLTLGQAYRVKEEVDGYYTTLYRLVGIQGEFNSVWFDELPDNYKPTYVVTSSQIPDIGMCLEIRKLSFSDKGRVSRKRLARTAPLTVVVSIAEQTYRVETYEAIYIVHCL